MLGMLPFIIPKERSVILDSQEMFLKRKLCN